MTRSEHPEANRAVVFLSRGGVVVIKSIDAGEPGAAVLDAARRLDDLRATRLMSPVRLTVRGVSGVAAFDATWTAEPELGTLDLVRRGYLATDVVRAEGKLTQPVQALLERIAELALSGARLTGPT